MSDKVKELCKWCNSKEGAASQYEIANYRSNFLAKIKDAVLDKNSYTWSGYYSQEAYILAWARWLTAFRPPNLVGYCFSAKKWN